MRCVIAETGETGKLYFQNGEVVFTSEKVKPEYVIFKSFINAHTHLGDSILKDPPRLGLIEMVGKDGLKFKVLRNARDDEIIDEMRNSIEYAYKSGTNRIFDFREEGIKGAELLKKADKRGIVEILSRPSNEVEAEKLISLTNGFGFSSVRDHDMDFLEFCRDLAKNKIFAIHAGELDNEDVEQALALEPDMLIHMNMAEKRLLLKAMDEGIDIVSCMRSNAFFNVFNLENYRILSEYENWLIGTDNVMISSPNMLDEVKFASSFIDAERVYYASTKNSTKFVIARMEKMRRSENLIRSVVRRLESCDIIMITEIRFE